MGDVDFFKARSIKYIKINNLSEWINLIWKKYKGKPSYEKAYVNHHVAKKAKVVSHIIRIFISENPKIFNSPISFDDTKRLADYYKVIQNEIIENGLSPRDIDCKISLGTLRLILAAAHGQIRKIAKAPTLSVLPLNTKWDFFFIKENFKQRLVIAKYTLEIQANGHMALISPRNKYHGALTKNHTMEGVLLIKEVSLENKIYNRRIFVKFSSEPKYLEGIMVSQSSTSEMYSNSILLIKHDVRKQTLTMPEEIDFYSIAYKELPSIVTNYFIEPDTKRLSLINNKIDPRDESLDVEKFASQFKKHYQYKLYISAPINSLKGKRNRFKYNLLKKILFEYLYSELYTNCGIGAEDIYCLASKTDHENIDNNLLPNKARVAFDNYRKSEFYILFLPLKITSSALLEASWIFHENPAKRSVFIVDKRVKLPSFFHHKCTDQNVIVIQEDFQECFNLKDGKGSMVGSYHKFKELMKDKIQFFPLQFLRN